MTTIDTTAITVELPEALDERWSRLPGIQIDGRRITIDPADYFFRFESSTWLVADWELVKARLLDVEETAESAVEQLALDFIKTHAESTSDAARVLRTAYEVYAYLFRDEHLASLGLPQLTSDHLRMLREAATLMALNKVELDGRISNVGPCWFFPAATSVVFDLDDETGGMLTRSTTAAGSTSTAASSPSKPTPLSADGSCTAASPCRTSPAASWRPTVPRWPPSATTSRPSRPDGSSRSTPTA